MNRTLEKNEVINEGELMVALIRFRNNSNEQLAPALLDKEMAERLLQGQRLRGANAPYRLHPESTWEEVSENGKWTLRKKDAEKAEAVKVKGKARMQREKPEVPID